MKLEKYALVAEIVGGLAVVVTLAFLIVEIRGNTNAIRSAAAEAVHDNYSTWYSSVAGDPELLGLSIKGMKDYSSLSEVEKGQFVAMFMAFTSHSQNAFYKWQDGSLAPELWQGWEFVSMNFLSTPGGEEFWGERGYMFSDAYRQYVETEILPREPHPLAKPWGVFEIGQ